MKRFRRVLIANRGEIALRVIRTLRDLGLESVAIYSEADHQSLHRREADYAVRLPGQLSAETYLNIPSIIEAAQLTGADAVHPGYGFLSESPSFADACAKAGLTFIGPSGQAMGLLGDKIHAKTFMAKQGLPTVPGAHSPIENLSELAQAGKTLGYPLILKAAAGGGGRGMRIVRSEKELEPAFESCKREALAYFGNGAVFYERYLEHPRHIEFQVLVDQHGNGVHLFERDCSIQRRHQKLFEEAPSQFLDDHMRAHLGGLAVKAALAAGYSGVGTIEFICESPKQAYFMEMNTRIQVEHPVTEMITGIDLIAEQIKVALGEKLTFKQEDITISGWSVEARINAEDASRDFRPCPGRIDHIRFPQGPFVRVDSHLYPGYEIPSFYDSMVAKIITWGRTRQEALKRMERALAELDIEGVPATTAFHEALIQHPEFKKANFTTRFLEETKEYFRDALSGHQGVLQNPLLAASVAFSLQRDKSAPVTVTAQEQWGLAARLESVNETIA